MSAHTACRKPDGAASCGSYRMRFPLEVLHVTAALCAVSALSTGCSLTYQSLYEGDARFEHCYRLDEEKQIPTQEKQRCWHEWSAKHTYGQSRDRIEYAIARERALGQTLASGETAQRGLVFPGGIIWAPQPLSAFAPPPQMMSRDAGTDAEQARTAAAFAGHADPPPVAAPGASCGGACNKAWVQCGEQCKMNACQSGCDDRYRVCMRSCF
jgi:hypothetical protein